MAEENAEAPNEPPSPAPASPTEFFYGSLDEATTERRRKERVTVTLQDAWTSKIREVVEGGARTSTSKAPLEEDEQDKHESWMFKLAQEADQRNAKEMKQKGSTRKAKAPGLLRVKGRRRNSVKYDIFAEFGKDHEGLVEIEVGGVIRQRANFRRYWHSEPELQRWKQGLLDNARHDKIFDGTRRMANREHYNSEMADLTQKHNGLFRQREPAHVPKNRPAPFRHLRELQAALMISTSDGKTREKTKRNTMQAFLQSDFLRSTNWAEQRIQKILGGPDGTEKGTGTRESIQTGTEQQTASQAVHAVDEGDLDVEHMSDQEAGIHSFFEFLRRRCPTGPNGTLDDVFNAFDTKKKGVISFSEMNAGLVKLGYDGDIIHVWRLLDANSSGSVAIKDLQKLKPYVKQYEGIKTKERKMLARKSMTAGVASMTDPKSPSASQDSSESGLDCDDQDEESTEETRKSQTPGGRQQRFFLEQARKCKPQTLVIVVFKNCDRAHPGVPVFAARSPTSLAQLLFIASQACPPVVGPAEAMYDLNFNLVRKLEDVINGGSYLLKGAEVTLDPPASFFTQLPGCLPSLKEVAAVSRFAASEREFEPSPTRASQADLSRASTAQGASRPSSKGPQGPPMTGADSFSVYEPSSRPSSRALGSYWEVDGVIARKMGLGSTKHRNWDINPVLGSRPGTSSDVGQASHFEDF